MADEKRENAGLTDQLKKVMIDRHVTQKELAEGVGTNTQTIYNSLSRDTFISKSTTKILNYLQCDIVLRDRETGKIYD